jgi:hypothetical protein
MRIYFTMFFLLAGCFSVAAQSTDTLRLMSYNLLNFPNGRDDCGTNIVVPARWDSLRVICDYVAPDVLMVCELQTEAGADSILHRALNVNGKTSYRRANFVLNQSSFFNRDLNNMFFYDSDKLILLGQYTIATDTRDIGYYRTRVLEAGAQTDTIYIDFYVGHFKASSADTASREATCQIIRDHIEAQPAGRRVVLGGDFNFYTDQEAGYQILLSGNRPLRDPINRAGVWSNNADFVDVHTQSTRSLSNPFYDCGAVGGVDDRFDFILLDDSAMQSHRVRYIPNSYTALGNNGSTFNTRINNPINTSSVPRNVLNALFHTSDHLPIILDLELSAIPITFSIRLENWTGITQETGHLLTWRIGNATQSTVDYFEIQESDDAMTFVPLAQVVSTVGQSDYSYFRPNVDALKYYRLSWSEQTTGGVYSQIIAIQPNDISQTWAFYPNPSRDILNIKAPASLENATVEIRFMDATGRVAWQTNCNFSARFADIDISHLQTGLYLVALRYAGGAQRVLLHKR